MKVRYIYSACIEIETSDLRILTDPWFTDGAYDGSWYHFPKLEDPFSIIREPDVIYVSHIHPDHYDPRTLEALFERFGRKPVLIPEFERNYLAFKARQDNIEATPTSHASFGGTELHIVPNVTESQSDVDSALMVHAGGKTLLNLNDCVWNDSHVLTLQDLVSGYTNELDLLALGYTGAGPYPQTYYDAQTERDVLVRKAQEKKEQFFSRYRRYCNAFPAKRHLPFAGKYLLGGKLVHLNEFRGVADAVEVFAFDDRAVVLADGGAGEIDFKTMEATAIRREAYSAAMIEARLAEIRNHPLDYEREIALPYEKINFFRLLRQAYANALRKSELEDDYWFVMHVERDGQVTESFEFNIKKGTFNFSKVAGTEQLHSPRSEYFVDYRHLFGCLTTVYHWNNSEIGSFVRVRRTPDEFNRVAQNFLNFFTCA